MNQPIQAYSDPAGNPLENSLPPLNLKTVKQIRNNFLEACLRNNYVKIDGASVLPDNDPTLLFITAGMAPLKPYFTTENHPAGDRLCNVQLCIRTTDIDSIGDDDHLTCFEMLGNWTLKSLDKFEALKFAFNLVTVEFEINPENLFVSFYKGDVNLPAIPPDMEVLNIWRQLGIPEDQIIGLPAADNLWGPAGDTGPLGPCSEIFLDRGEAFGEKDLELNPKRFVEIWNAGVFMQFNKCSDGSIDPLPSPSLDAGAGVERWAMFLQNKTTVYDIDTIRPIIDTVVENSSMDRTSVPARIITDHIRTATHIIAEGVLPGNKRQGYVLRKLIRRAACQAYINNLDMDSLSKASLKTIEVMGEDYPKLTNNAEKIVKVINDEAQSLMRILSSNKIRKHLDNLLAVAVDNKIDTEQAFNLSSTLGIPKEIIESLAQSKGLIFDAAAYDVFFARHRELSNRPKN